MDKLNKIKVSFEEKNEIKKDSPETLPLNPTAQGFSGQEVRRRLYKSLTGENGSILSLIIDKMDISFELFKEILDEKINFEGGNTGQVLTKASDENFDFIWAESSGSGSSDVMIGTARVYTESLPLSGLRIIDNVELVVDDRVLVAGLGELNGIYIVQSGDWILERVVQINQVVSIDNGDVYGGSQLKKLSSGITKMVKKPERTEWSVK